MLAMAATPTGSDIRVVDQLNELGADRDVRPRAFDVIGEGRRADRENQILPLEQSDDLLAHRRQESREQPMVLGETAATGHRRPPNARVVALGELHHRVPSAVAIYRGASDERRPLARVERGADLIDHIRLGA